MNLRMGSMHTLRSCCVGNFYEVEIAVIVWLCGACYRLFSIIQRWSLLLLFLFPFSSPHVHGYTLEAMARLLSMCVGPMALGFISRILLPPKLHTECLAQYCTPYYLLLFCFLVLYVLVRCLSVGLGWLALMVRWDMIRVTFSLVLSLVYYFVLLLLLLRLLFRFSLYFVA